jgi:hypothetical protein
MESLESLLSQLEQAYYNAKIADKHRQQEWFEVEQTRRQRIKDEIIGRFADLEDELQQMDYRRKKR